MEALFSDGTKAERHRQYESALAELHRKFSDDVDGASFYALAILGTAENGRDFATYMRAAAVLEEVFPQHPRHPGVVHYLIHCYDDSVHAPLLRSHRQCLTTPTRSRHSAAATLPREAAFRVESGEQRFVEWMKQQKMRDSMIPMFSEIALIYNGELHPQISAAEGKTQEAVTERQRIAAQEHAMPLEFGPPNIEKPSDELLGELLLQLNRPSEARDAFQAALARAPGRRLVVEDLARTDKEMAAAK